MQRVTAPSIIAGLLALSMLSFSLVLIDDPGPFAPGSALLIAIGSWSYALIAIAGMLLVRAPWARWLGLGTAAGTLVVVAAIGFDSGLAFLAIGTALIAIFGLAGPWLTGWLRQRPGTGPEPAAVSLPLVAIGAPAVAGIAAWDGLAAAVVIAAIVGPVAAWAYGRSLITGLWTLRVVYPIAAGVAAMQLEPAGAALMIAHGASVAVLSWSRAASRAQRSSGGPLPAPRSRKRKP